MEPNGEIAQLRKELSELREKMYDRGHEYAEKHGFAEGWRRQAESRLDRLEKKLDDLFFALLEERNATEKARTKS